jgi:hypothetical protein
MTVIGSKTDRLYPPADSAKGEAQHASLRMHGLFHSLTYSLELACRGYLCAPLVDCDPVTDPECSEAGKKLLFPDPAVERGRISAADEIQLPDA